MSHLTRMLRSHTYSPIGRCIYCGEHEKRLTLEHIIPESFGGMLRLPTASCDDCAKETAAFEGRCAGQIFRPARRILGFPQKNRSAKRKTGPETFSAHVDGTEVRVEAPDFPGMLMSFTFEPPGILLNLPPSEKFAGRVVINQLPSFGERLGRLNSKHPVAKEISLGMPAAADDLGRMLAKIGHAYAIAELGLGAFKPYLPGIILNRPPLHIGHYVGGLFGDSPQGTDLHEITIEPDFWGPKHVVVEVQLFADRQMPKYLVYVGERLADCMTD